MFPNPAYNTDFIIQEHAALKQENINLRLEIQLLKAQILELEKNTLMHPPAYVPVQQSYPVQNQYVQAPYVPSYPAQSYTTLPTPLVPVQVQYDTTINYCPCGSVATMMCAGRPNGILCNRWHCSSCLQSRWYSGNEYFLCSGCHYHHRHHYNDSQCVVQ
jgi:hypothetical protein